MTATLITLLIVLAGVAVLVLMFDMHAQQARRRDRHVVRRVQRYLDSLPPAKPW